MHLSPIRKEDRGYLSSAVVWGVVVMLIAVSFGALIFGKIQTVAKEQVTVGTLEENIINQVGGTAEDVFPLILLMVLIAVLVGIVAVIKTLG